MAFRRSYTVTANQIRLQARINTAPSDSASAEALKYATCGYLLTGVRINTAPSDSASAEVLKYATCGYCMG